MQMSAMSISAVVSLEGALIVLCVIVIRWICDLYSASRRYTKFCREHGCAEPVVAKNALPWGLERYYQMVTFKGDLLDGLLRPRFQELGATYIFNGLFGCRVINTIDPENIHTVLALKFKDWEMGQQRRDIGAPLLGSSGIFTADGAAWEHSRAMMRPQFTREQFTDMQLFQKHTTALLQALAVDASGWTQDVDLAELFLRFTLDTSTEFLFGESVDSQRATLAESDQADGQRPSSATLLAADRTDGTGRDRIRFAEAFHISQSYLARRFRLQALYFLVDSPRFRQSCALIHRFVDHFVDRALAQPDLALRPAKPLDVASSKPRYVLLSQLASSTADRLHLRNQLVHVLIAGRDTTASALSWVFHLLARNPAVLSRLRAKILCVFGTEGTTQISYDRLKTVKYLQWVIQETLRLYPALPMNNRVAARDTVLPRGGGRDGRQPIAVMRGQKLIFSVYAMQRRTDLWGDDAEVFRPERWEERRPGWEYLPWSGGPRVCLGQQFATAEIGYVVVRMLQRFERIETDGGGREERKDLTLTVSPGGGVKVRLGRGEASSGE